MVTKILQSSDVEPTAVLNTAPQFLSELTEVAQFSRAGYLWRTSDKSILENTWSPEADILFLDETFYLKTKPVNKSE